MEPPRRRKQQSWSGRGVIFRPVRDILALIVPDEPPLELQIVGRTLLHAAMVGLVAGLVGSAFLWALEHVQALTLEDLCGYVPLRAAGEYRSHLEQVPGPFRWYLLAFVPAIGGLVCGLLTRRAPEARGGGGDAAIEAFHYKQGDVPDRVLWIKPAASIATLGTGGSGGREGPTMQIGAAIGSVVGKYLRLSGRERRTLMVAGIAAGISAVFRTPLGAALLAIEVLYRDDFESEALIPAVLASVIAYSVALSVFGTEPLFGTLPRYPFHPAQLWMYVLLALAIAAFATLFEKTLHFCRGQFAKLRVPDWLRPGVGGLVLGAFVVTMMFTVDPWFGNSHRGMGVLGGGYGAAQVGISGVPWVAPGWNTVELLLVLGIAKIFATSVTIGSGGSAGDFAPTVAIGGMIGGAFGGAMQLLLNDPSINPGAFALVGMAAFYAGIANTPLAALIIVCEVAGSYDLLVPLMLTEGIAMIALRKINLYKSQPRSMKDSPVHARILSLRCGDVIDRAKKPQTLHQKQSIHVIAGVIESTPDQDVFPVLDDEGKVVGLVAAESLRTFVVDGAQIDVAIVADVMLQPLVFTLRDDVRTAALALVRRDLRSAPVLDETGAIAGMIDEHDIMRALSVSPGESQA